MRVCFVTTGLDAGGAETALVRLVQDLAVQGMQASVIALRGSGRLVAQLQENRIEVTVLDISGLAGSMFAMPRTIRTVRAFKPDIIQGWMYHGNLMATVLAALCGVRLLWSIRQALGALDRERASTNRLIRFGARLSGRPTHIVYNSQRSRADHEAIGYSPASGLVIDNGFDTDALRPDAGARVHWRKRLGLTEDSVLVGHLARYHPVKDHETFLRAAFELCNREPRIHLLMAGYSVDASNRELNSAIERLGLSQRVALLGEIDDVTGFLPGLDLLCVSSRSEAFPNVLGEAMSCGVPCVTTDVGDAARIVDDTGQVVPPGDSHLLAVAMQTIAALSPAERAHRGVAARQRIIENFTLRSMTERYSRLYDDCVQRN
jgi:glycosyltransferase involved in cell wall biosynthesis